MAFAKRLALLVVVMTACVGCDQATKSMARSYLPETQALTYLSDTVRLQVIHNPGAFLSLGASLPDVWRHWLLVVGAGSVLLGFLLYGLLARSAGPSLVWAVALVVAGGASNLADRLAYNGYVVDFINVGIGPLRTGIFNFADVAIMAGVGVLLVSSLVESQPSGSKPGTLSEH